MDSKMTNATSPREGKTKILTPLKNDASQLRVEFKSIATAFNALKKQDVAGKGELNAEISALLFSYLEEHGIATCFVRREPNEANVLIFQSLTMMPVEVIVRNHAYGSFCKRFPFVELGTVFAKPLIEFCLKDDALGDPPLPEDALHALNLIPPNVSIEQLKRLARQVNTALTSLFDSCNIHCADFKLEFGLNKDGQLIVADELSPDNFRLRDKTTGDVLDKDVFRLDIGNINDAYGQVLTRLQQYQATHQKDS